jgi:hypothetical protein
MIAPSLEAWTNNIQLDVSRLTGLLWSRSGDTARRGQTNNNMLVSGAGGSQEEGEEEDSKEMTEFLLEQRCAIPQ